MSPWRRLKDFSAESWTIFLPGAMAVILRLGLLPWLPVPYPATTDEFSYLLGADTLSHGRLTNQAHPLWRFFETIHVISIPTYASKYPPGQAFFLAIGERLFGNPFFGSVLACLVFVSAVVWMLRAWMASEMALVGGFITAFAFGTGNYWLDSYWGGFVGATGAALVLGAVGRIREQKRFHTAWSFAAGSILLWFTRPFEGAFLILAVGTLLLFDVVRGRFPAGIDWKGSGLRSFVTVLLICGASTLAFQAYYDFRVTGHAALLPYSLHHREYDYAPVLWFQQPQIPTLDANPVVREAHQEWEMGVYHERRDLMLGWRHGNALQKLITPTELKEALKILELVAAVVVIVVLSILFWADHSVRALWFLLFLSMVPILLENTIFAHYMVGVTAVLIVLVFQLISLCRELRWRDSASGTVLAAFLIGALFCGVAGNNAYRAWREVKNPFPFKLQRAHVQQELTALSGQQVVFVHYTPVHNVNLEWVYNSADIDAQKLVWARDLGSEQNQQLIAYYSGRHFWSVNADSDIPEPVPYQP